MSSDVRKIAVSSFPRKENNGSKRTTRGAMQCQAQYTVDIYAKSSQEFAKLTKMQSPSAKPLNTSFLFFFYKNKNAKIIYSIHIAISSRSVEATP